MDKRIAIHIAANWPGKTAATLRPADIHQLRQQWTQTLAYASLYSYTKALKRLLRYVDTNFGTHHASHVPRMPQPQPRKKTCTDDDFAQIKNHAKPWLRAFLELTRTLALRHSEALALTPRHLNEDTNTLLFRRKDHGSSDLPLTPELAAAIRFCKATQPDQPIIRTLGGPSTQAAVREAWNRAKKRAKANPALIIHDLRRTAITRVYDNTKDLRLCQQLAGHTHLASTLLYLAPTEKDELAQAIREAAPSNLANLKLATEVKQ